MKIKETPLKDCLIIENQRFGDERGYFMESFNQMKLTKEIHDDFNIKQVNFATSAKNVLRGLHYQDHPYAQTKIVGVTHGAVLDVVVDIRKDSPTYKQHFKIKLDAPETLLLVPKGFAHGYLSLENDTLFYYFVDSFYSPEHEKGILYNDPALKIDWEIHDMLIVSEKDQQQPVLTEAVNNF